MVSLKFSSCTPLEAAVAVIRRVVYVVTSRGRDRYSAMTRVSLASLRLSNPGTCGTVVVDSLSDRLLAAAADPLPGEADEYLVMDVPFGDDSYRNRYLKTGLRSHLDGQYLFLDSDTLIRRDISALFSSRADLAGATNGSTASFPSQIPNVDGTTLTALGWTIRSDVYLNGGVLLCNDTLGARRLGELWAQNWITSYLRTGRYNDQAALNAAIFESGICIEVIPDSFNAQFMVTPISARDAAVWHYYSSFRGRSHTVFEHLVDAIVENGTLDMQAVKSAISSEHPWRSKNAIDDLAAARIFRRNSFDGWEAAWLQRRWLHHVALRSRAAVGRSWRLISPIR